MNNTEKRDTVLNRYSGDGWDYPDHEAMAARIVELEAAIERVRALHVRVQGKYFPAFCEHCDSRSYPCDTIAALEETP